MPGIDPGEEESAEEQGFAGEKQPHTGNRGVRLMSRIGVLKLVIANGLNHVVTAGCGGG